MNLSWLGTWGPDLSLHLTLSDGGSLCAKLKLHSLLWQAWLGLLGHCHHVTCTSHAAVPKTLPLILVSLSIYIFNFSIKKAFCAVESQGPYYLSFDSEKLVIWSFDFWGFIYSHLTLCIFP